MMRPIQRKQSRKLKATHSFGLQLLSIIHMLNHINDSRKVYPVTKRSKKA